MARTWIVEAGLVNASQRDLFCGNPARREKAQRRDRLSSPVKTMMAFAINRIALRKMKEIRCGHCNALLAKVGRTYTVEIKCRRCGTINNFEAYEPSTGLPNERLSVKDSQHDENPTKKPAGGERLSI